VALHSGFGRAALELARLDLLLARPAEAERVLAGLIRRHPRWADAHAMLGRARRLRGNPYGAADALRQALRLNPAYGAAREDLAWALQHSVGSDPEAHERLPIEEDLNDVDLWGATAEADRR
jgi:predicted Zn-dependent protease